MPIHGSHNTCRGCSRERRAIHSPSASGWGRGYAVEAAQVAVRVAFGELGLDEVVAFTVPANKRSISIMTKLGMVHAPQYDFDHPKLPAGHPLRRHVLYRLAKSANG